MLVCLHVGLWSLCCQMLFIKFYFSNMLFHWLILHRGLAPQNKPELQKVLEKRKREQVIKAQKEEQEAHKKRSDLEIELMKRQQKLEQVNDWYTFLLMPLIQTYHLFLLLHTDYYLYNVTFSDVCILAAGAGATERWGGTGEHPWVCEDEEQPAQDQAGGWRRGTNHLKTSRGVWVWLIVRVFVGTETSGVCGQERMCVMSVVHSGDLTMVQAELPGFPDLAVPSCSEERDFTD